MQHNNGKYQYVKNSACMDPDWRPIGGRRVPHFITTVDVTAFADFAVIIGRLQTEICEVVLFWIQKQRCKPMFLKKTFIW